jgi:hypothetical protein
VTSKVCASQARGRSAKLRRSVQICADPTHALLLSSLCNTYSLQLLQLYPRHTTKHKQTLRTVGGSDNGNRRGRDPSCWEGLMR